MDLAIGTAGDGAGIFHGVIGPLQHRARFLQKFSSCIGQFQRLGAAFKELHADFVFEVVDLPADTRLRDVQLQRCA